MRTTQALAPLVLAALLAGPVLPAARGQNPEERPNVLLIVIDDLGVDKLEAYDPPTQNPPIPHTPTISSLAAQGVLFERAWAYALCSPTRAILLTGRYGFRNGIGTLHKPDHPLEQGPLSLAELLLPEVIDRADTGHAHAAFGKWHLGYYDHLGVPGDPENPGFGWFVGTEGNLDPRVEPPQGFEYWPKTVNGVTSTSTSYLTTDTVDEALAWMLAQGSQPWVCQVAFNSVHAPHHRPPGFNLPNAVPGRDEEVWPYHNAMIESVDGEIGRLLLQYQRAEPERSARTTVMLTADNGTAGWGWADGTLKPLVFPPFDRDRMKGTLYEGGLHVPMIVYGHGVGAPGSRCAALVSLVDVFATVADIVGIDLGDPAVIEPWRTLDSVSFWPQVADPAAPPARAFVYSELFSPNNPEVWPPASLQRAVCDARYKLIRRENAQPKEELFDLWNDPYELVNLLVTGGPDRMQIALAYARLTGALAAHTP